MLLGHNLARKIECLVRRTLAHGSLFKSTSLNFLPPFLLFSRSAPASLERLVSGSVYPREASPARAASAPLGELPSLVVNKKDLPKLVALKSLADSRQKKAFRQQLYLSQGAASRKNSLFKAGSFDAKARGDLLRRDSGVWGARGLRENFLYSLTDLFENGAFNMEFVRKLSAREVSLRKKYLSLLKKKPEYVSKEDIKRIKALRKELRLKIKDLERGRLELLQKQTKHRLVGFKSHLGGACTPAFGQFTAQEVLIARVCRLNGLARPPNYREFLELSKKEKPGDKRKSGGQLGSLKQNLASISGSLLHGAQEMSLSTVLEFERALLRHVQSSLLDFGSVESLVFPAAVRADQYLDLDLAPVVFQKFLFYFEPGAFEHSRAFLGDNAAHAWVKKRVAADKQVFFVDLDSTLAGGAAPAKPPDAERPGEEAPPDSLPPRSQRAAKKKAKTELLVHFQHADWPQLPHQKTSLVLSKVDVVRNRVLKTEERLELSNNAHLIKRAEDQAVYRISGFLPNAYALSLFSRHCVHQMSEADYLARVKKWPQHVFRVHTAEVLPGVPCVLTRFEVAFEASDEGERGLLLLDFEWTSKEAFKKQPEPKKPKPPKKKEEPATKSKGKFNRLYQVFGQKKQEEEDDERSRSKPESAAPDQSLSEREDLELSLDSEDEFQDERLHLGRRLGAASVPDNQRSFLSRFLFFELVRKEDAGEAKTRAISKEGFFEDSHVELQGPLDRGQRVGFAPGKYVLTVSAVAPEPFPAHDVDFKVTSSPGARLRHLGKQSVADFAGLYSPNKYFSLFHDKLLFTEDWATLSFHLQLLERTEPCESRSEARANEAEAGKAESKRRKRGAKERDKAEEGPGSFDLSEFREPAEDVHVVLELHYRDRLLFRFGGRRAVSTAAFCLHKRGPDKSESMSKTHPENSLEPEKKDAPEAPEGENLLRDVELGFKFPSRMTAKAPAKRAKAADERPTETNTTNKTGRSWAVGEWTLKAFLDPRQGAERYSDRKKNSASNRFRRFVADPEKVKYFDLRRTHLLRGALEGGAEHDAERGARGRPKGGLTSAGVAAAHRLQRRSAHDARHSQGRRPAQAGRELGALGARAQKLRRGPARSLSFESEGAHGRACAR